jgi:GT2 family glycosyltransferase/peptidoglycan/xylan/chitin deacetylase (PgdA/CDA1 family)
VTATSPYELTVVIASCNRRELLRRCLSALEHQTQDLDTFEIVVADDGSTDGTAEMVEELMTKPRLRVLKLGKGGKSPALNAAIEASEGAICLFLDDDIVASPELVAAHIAAHEANSKSIGIGALTQQPPEARDWYAHAFAKAWGEHYEELEHRPSQWSDCYGGNLSAPRLALTEVGGFATDLPSAEDIELGYRLWRAGCDPKYLPHARAIHDDQKRRRRMLEDARRLGACWPVFIDRHPSMCPELIGWFREASFRDVMLRRVLLALRMPPIALAAIGPLVPGKDRQRIWFGFVARYALWHGVRRSMSRDRWLRTISGIPVLMYHAFTDAGERDRYILPKRSFKRQMRLLAALRYRVVGFEEMAKALRDNQPLPRRAVVITIDDGYRDNYEIAHPILRRHGFPATMFIVSKRVGGKNDWNTHGAGRGRPLLSLGQIERLRADGIRIGAHTRTHCSLPEAADDRIIQEVMGSREDLELAISAPVTTFAYPYGRLDERAVAAANKASFLGACTTHDRLAYHGDDPLRIPRIEVRGSDTSKTFLRKLWFGGG